MSRFPGFTIVALLAFNAGALAPRAFAHEPPPSPNTDKQAAPITLPSMQDTKPRDYPGIHNAVAYHPGFISGSAPDGEQGLETLAAMGIKTIITVDGAEPQAAKAKALGMRYIHLPIGYNGFDEQRKLQLTRATRDAMKDGPVYIHCHHGKHRSAGAAAAIASSLAWLTPDEGVERMRVSGTAPNYTGLYTCAAGAAALDEKTINAVPADFPEVSRPAGFVKAMVEMDEAFDHLKYIEQAGWQTPKDHPDLVPAAEAGRLADLLRLVAEGDRAKEKPADFGKTLKDDAALAAALEEKLAAGSNDTADLSARFKKLGASCKDCHAKYRD